MLASCDSTYGYNPESQSPNRQAMISKMMEEDRKAPLQVRDRFNFWTWVGTAFSCLMLGICSTAPNVQCGVQGVQSRTYTKDYSTNTSKQERVTGGSYASEAEFPWSVALRLGNQELNLKRIIKGFLVKEGLSCVFSAKQLCGKTHNLAFP